MDSYEPFIFQLPPTKNFLSRTDIFAKFNDRCTLHRTLNVFINFTRNTKIQYFRDHAQDWNHDITVGWRPAEASHRIGYGEEVFRISCMLWRRHSSIDQIDARWADQNTLIERSVPGWHASGKDYPENIQDPWIYGYKLYAFIANVTEDLWSLTVQTWHNSI